MSDGHDYKRSMGAWELAGRQHGLWLGGSYWRWGSTRGKLSIAWHEGGCTW